MGNLHTSSSLSSLGCPGRETLSDLALGRLPPDSIDAIGRHVEQCPSCQSELGSFDSVADSVIRGLRRGPGLPLDRLDPAWAEHLRRAEGISHVVWQAAREPIADDRPPNRLGQYELLGQIGRGGMGTVYKAMHVRLRRHVALKLLPAERVPGRQAVARFRVHVRSCVGTFWA